MSANAKGYLVLLSMTYSVVCCYAQNTSNTDSTQAVYDAVRRLPEIKAYMHDTDSIYGSKGVHPAMMITHIPTKERPYYCVQVGIGMDNGYRILGEFVFNVYPPEMELRYAYEEDISLKEWRKETKKRKYKKEMLRSHLELVQQALAGLQ